MTQLGSASYFKHNREGGQYIESKTIFVFVYNVHLFDEMIDFLPTVQVKGAITGKNCCSLLVFSYCKATVLVLFMSGSKVGVYTGTL